MNTLEKREVGWCESDRDDATLFKFFSFPFRSETVQAPGLFSNPLSLEKEKEAALVNRF